MAGREFLFDRMAGCLLGMAVGEAMGRPATGLSPYDVMRRYQVIDHFFSSAGVAPGQYGDGSRIALRLAFETCHPGEFSRASVARAHIDLRGKVGPPWSGPIDRMHSGTPSTESGEKGTHEPLCFKGVPVGLWACMGAVTEEALLKASREAALPTHSERRAALPVFCVAYVIRECIRNPTDLGKIRNLFDGDCSLMARLVSWTQKAEQSLEHMPDDPLGARLDLVRKALQSKHPMESFLGIHGNAGSAESCVAFALLCFMRGPDDFRSMCSAASMGGGSSTTAAVVGTLCGAFAGRNFLRRDMEREVANSVRIQALAESIAGRAVCHT